MQWILDSKKRSSRAQGREREEPARTNVMEKKNSELGLKGTGSKGIRTRRIYMK